MLGKLALSCVASNPTFRYTSARLRVITKAATNARTKTASKASAKISLTVPLLVEDLHPSTNKITNHLQVFREAPEQ